MALTVEQVTEPTDELRGLIEALEAELAMNYSPEQRHGLALAALFQPHLKIFMARLDGVAAACGGVAFFGDYAEVKRMFVRPPARGRGLARALLARIEAEARDAGMRLLRLETGDAQRAALRLYEAAGFTRCGAFGDYLALDARAIAKNIFFKRPCSSPKVFWVLFLEKKNRLPYFVT